MPDEAVAESSPAEPETAAPEPEQAETPAPEPESEASAASESESDQDESVSASEAAKPPEGTSKAERRIKQLTAQVRSLERKLQTQPQPEARQPAKAPDEPKLDDFNTIEDFQKAHGKWKEDYKSYVVEQDRVAQRQKAFEETAKREQAEMLSAWNKNSQRILKENPDFNVKEAIERVSPLAGTDGLLFESEVGPELLDFLDMNPDEADRIRDLERPDLERGRMPYKALRELFKLEERLSLQVKGIKSKPTLVKPPGKSAGRAAAPSRPKTAAEVLYG